MAPSPVGHVGASRAALGWAGPSACQSWPQVPCGPWGAARRGAGHAACPVCWKERELGSSCTCGVHSLGTPPSPSQPGAGGNRGAEVILQGLGSGVWARPAVVIRAWCHTLQPSLAEVSWPGIPVLPRVTPHVAVSRLRGAGGWIHHGQLRSCSPPCARGRPQSDKTLGCVWPVTGWPCQA